MDIMNQWRAHTKRRQRQQDREYALRLAGFEPDTAEQVEMDADEQLARDMYEEEVSNLLGKSTATEEVEDEPGDTDAEIYVRGPERRVCVACHDSPGSIVVPCEHRYCADCLTHLLRAAMDGGTAFPPTCCGREIPVSDVHQHLDRNFVHEFEEKAIELSTPNPVYCYFPGCSTFIPPGTIQGDDDASCPACSRATCTHCKAQTHFGDCREDEGTQQVLQMARVEGWRRCECGIMIELDMGCNHMTAS